MKTKNITVLLAVVAAIVIAFIGLRSFACDSPSKSANANGSSTYTAGSGVCSYSGTSCSGKQAAGCQHNAPSENRMTGSQNPQCEGHRDWAVVITGNRGYYDANVFAVLNGHMYAVCQGKQFEVSDLTPYTQMDAARYYFADETSRIRCSERMKTMAKAIDQETVALATTDGNVVSEDNGFKVARCPVTGREFIVTADSPVRVVDGKRYYLSAEQDLSTLDMPAHP
jgi:hypothetical protein